MTVTSLINVWCHLIGLHISWGDLLPFCSYQNHWNCQGGPHTWPERFPDFKSLHHCPQGHMKEMVYSQRTNNRNAFLQTFCTLQMTYETTHTSCGCNHFHNMLLSNMHSSCMKTHATVFVTCFIIKLH